MNKSDLVVLTFNEEQKAGEVLTSLAKMSQENLIALEDAAVVVKNEKGKVKIRQTMDITAGKGAVSGSFWGLLIGFLFGGPLFGALWGIAIGALWGKSIDLGVSDRFMKEVGDSIEPGDSAVFMLIRDMTMDKVTAELSQFGGTLYHTSLSAEAETALQKALQNEEVAQAADTFNEIAVPA